MMTKYGVVMAGGGGTRFWPLSRQKTPKQLLNLTGKGAMINETIDRLAYTVALDHVFVVTNADQADTMRRVTAGRVRNDHILSEPCARNTAACVGYAATEVMKKYGDGLMIVVPSDAYIRDVPAFTRVLAEAAEAAEKQDKLVTIGIRPTFAATGYGYIRYNDSLTDSVKIVEDFKEKPDLATAEEYIARSNYLWNSGMFLWKASVILEKFRQYIPDIYADLEKIGSAMKTDDEQRVIAGVYPSIRNISVDYAIMEPSAARGDVLVVPGDFGWNDVGSWDMMNAVHKADADGNILEGKAVALQTKDTTVYTTGKFVAVVGAQHLVVVETDDALLVCDKSRAQNVRDVVELLKAEGRDDLL